MILEFGALVDKHGLTPFRSNLERFLSPAVYFDLEKLGSPVPIGDNKVGGQPDLPKGFSWPKNKGRDLDFLLQIDLSEAAVADEQNILPTSGMLSFFYDLDKQPWGYDPDDLDGFRVAYTSPDTELERYDVPHRELAFPESRAVFRSGLTLPCIGSQSYDELEGELSLSDKEFDRYFELCDDLGKIGSKYSGSYGGNHHLLGHSANVQGDMQLEAQLVTNGLYCGDPSGYNDPRAKELAAGTKDWVLLLQLDTDDSGGFMWGDCGMLYFWIRSEDLKAKRFEEVWMALQCG